MEERSGKGDGEGEEGEWKATPLGYDGRRPSGEMKREFGGEG